MKTMCLNLGDRLVRAILRDGTILAGVQVSEVGMVACRTFILGALGERQLAAGALVQGVYTAVVLTAGGVLQAVPAMAAIRSSDARPAAQMEVLINGLVIAGVLSMLGCGILWSMPTLFRWTSQSPELVLEATRYIQSLWPSVVAGLIAAALYGYGTAIGRGKSLLVLTVAVTAVNLAAAWLLSLPGHLALGIRGVGFAATVSSVLLAVCFTFVVSDHFRACPRLPRPSREFAGRMMRLGMPFGVIFLSEMSFLTVITLLMGSIGQAELAAHAVAMQWVAVLLVFPVGFSQAAAVMVSRAVGDRSVRSVGVVGRTATLAICAILAVQAFAMLIWPLELGGVFLSATPSLETRNLAIEYMRLAAAAQFLNGVIIVLAGILRGLQEVRRPLVGAIVIYWGIGLPSAYLLAFTADFGGRGLWYGLNIGFLLAATVLLQKFSHYPQLFRHLSRRGSNP